MRRSTLSPRVPRLRSLAAGTVIAIGVVAAIATSGGGIVREQSEDFVLTLGELRQPVTHTVRACPAAGFFRRLEHTVPAQIELIAAFEDGADTEARVPVTLNTEDSRYRIDGALQGSATGLALRVIVPREEAQT